MKKKLTGPVLRNQKAHQRQRNGRTGPSAKKVKGNEEIPVTAKARVL